MVNVIPLDHVDDVPVVEPNQHDDVPVVPDHVLVDEDEDPEDEEFEKEEEPQEEKEDDMEIDIEEDENKPELTYPYEEVDPLNPPPSASESDPEDVIEVENTIESEDDTIPASVHEFVFGRMASLSRRLCGRETVHALVKKKRKAKDEYYDKLILDLGNKVRFSVEQGMDAMEKLVEKLGNAEDKVKCKKLKKELEEKRGFTFEERPNKAIDVPIEDEKTPSSEPQGSPRKLSMLLSLLEGLRTCECLEIDAEESTSVMGQDVETASFMSDNFVVVYKVVLSDRRTSKNEAQTVELKDKSRSEVTSSKPANLNEAVRMAHKLMEQKSQARDERILEGKKQKWERFQSGNSSGKNNHKENSRQPLQNNQKQGNARAMITAPTNGKVSFRSLPLCEHCFTRHVGPCTIKCDKYGKVGHKARYCKEKSVATGANAQPIPTCYDCGEQGHTRNRCPKKIKQEEVGQVRGRAYAIKDAKPQVLNVVTGMFLLNNRYAYVLFDSVSDRSFVDTRFSSMLNIDPVKIGSSYEVELDDGRVVSMNTVLKGCTLNLVNHIFEIDLMPIELVTFDIIIDMDWLVKHDAIIICGENVVRIPYGNKMLIVESDKGVSRLKVISCIKARKYVERGFHLFLAHVTKKKSKEKRLEDMPMIRVFPEVFPEEFPGETIGRRAPYRLAPSEIRELSVQLKELLEKGFICPSSSSWWQLEPVLFVKRKIDL
ncbi:putative reverse transcriptase domain-containing protein [Tanacetum coccineum]